MVLSACHKHMMNIVHTQWLWNVLKPQHLGCANTWLAQTLSQTLEILQSDRVAIFLCTKTNLDIVLQPDL